MKKNSFLLIFFLASAPSFAMNTKEATQSALDFGTIYKNQGSVVVTEETKINTPGYTTDNPEETKYYSGTDMEGDIGNKITTTEAGKLLSQNIPNRPKVEVSISDPFLKSSRQVEISDDVQEIINLFSGSYEQCTPIDVTGQDIETRTCDFYEDRDGGSCLVDQVVEVEAKHNYQCDIVRNIQEKICENVLDFTYTPGVLTEANFGNPRSPLEGCYKTGGAYILECLGYAKAPIHSNYPSNWPYSGFDTNLDFSPGQKVYIQSGVISGIFTVKSSTRFLDPYFSMPTFRLEFFDPILPSSPYANIKPITFKTKISDPQPIISSNWREVCPQ